jgi:hypothetical protein
VPRQLRRQFGSRADAQLAIDVGERPLDGFLASIELLGDLVVPPPADDEVDDGPLGIRQVLEHAPSVSHAVLGVSRELTLSTTRQLGR